jgi:DNA polymerase
MIAWPGLDTCTTAGQDPQQDSMIDARPQPTLAEQLAAAHAWWHEAGVDCDFADDPRDWLAKPETVAATDEAQFTTPARPLKPAEPEIPPLGGDRSGWPQQLADFAPWWLAEEGLETGGTAPRVAPRGSEGAALMVLVPMPEEGDSNSLLAGAQGKLIANMLTAMRIAEDAAYIAAALPRHAKHPDWQALAARQLGEIVAHHVRLARPKRLLVLGRAMLPLFGHDPAQGAAAVRAIALEGCDVPALASYGPEPLLATPRFRAALWRGWLEWTEGSV